MQTRHRPQSEVNQLISKTIYSRLDPDKYSAFIFGSRATNRGTDQSDIDIGIEGKFPVPAAIFADIEDAIQNLPLLYKMDLVDFKKVSPDFYNLAKSATITKLIRFT